VVTPEEAAQARLAFAGFKVRLDRPARLYDEAWRLADELGLATTYDAEFLALARLRECRVLTADARLHRIGILRGLTVDPTELMAELS
jgi:predicted nucleic acid-binding protein